MINGKTQNGYQNHVHSEVNPFIHRLNLSTLQRIKTGILLITLAPIRFLAVLLLKAGTALICYLALTGVSEEELLTNPLLGWRKTLRLGLSYLMRIWCMVAGFHNVKIKGTRASSKEAPILIMAPHSTYFDAVAFTYLGAPSVVVKKDMENLPIIKTIVNYTQPLYVQRDDSKSRTHTIEEMKRRSNSKEDWPQVMIFPEGTCTNRSCLIRFKVGAFLPGVPVQPVCLRYHNKPDTVTWAWEGPGLWSTIFLTFSQLHTNFEMEFLPVYVPSEEEKKHPRLFADNVRRVMADTLGVPTTDLTFHDCRIIAQSKASKLPFQNGIETFYNFRSAIRMVSSPEQELELYLSERVDKLKPLNIEQFSKILGVSSDQTEIKNLFQLFDRHEDETIGLIDFREYIIGLHIIQKKHEVMDRIQICFKLYDRKNKGYLRQSEFIAMMAHACNMNPKTALRIFNKISDPITEALTLETLKEKSKEDKELYKYISSYQPYMMTHDIT